MPVSYTAASGKRYTVLQFENFIDFFHTIQIFDPLTKFHRVAPLPLIGVHVKCECTKVHHVKEVVTERFMDAKTHSMMDEKHHLYKFPQKPLQFTWTLLCMFEDHANYL